MSFLKLLVPVTGGKRDAHALATAFAAAKPFSAHVVALFVHVDPREAIPFGELPLSPEFVQDLIDTAADVELAAANAARSTLATVAAEAGARLIGAPQKCDTVSVSYEEATGYLPQVLSRAARLCDLTVFPPIREKDSHDMPDGFARVLVKTACPVLLSAEKQLTTLGRRVAVGWDDGVACARALVAALPFLERADSIEILSVRNTPVPDRSAEEAAGYLALHGLSAARRTIPCSGRKVAEVLLDAAAKGDFDLLVTGGYGRGRITEAVFGGVTEHIVSHATLPVFMVH
jgi:nucleotide-binding universal stress UspA family protein